MIKWFIKRNSEIMQDYSRIKMTSNTKKIQQKRTIKIVLTDGANLRVIYKEIQTMMIKRNLHSKETRRTKLFMRQESQSKREEEESRCSYWS